MEQNNFYGQDLNNGVEENNDVLPTYDFSAEAPAFEQVYVEETAGNPEVEAGVNSAFGMALASVIMANFPLVSLVGVILGALALKGVKKVDNLAASYGVEAGGKRTAAKIMGMIGTIYGGVLTAFYGLYFGFYGCMILVAILSEM